MPRDFIDPTPEQQATGALGYFYKDEPVWDPFRSDPQFIDLLRRMVIPS
jgi:hypothetical protein